MKKIISKAFMVFGVTSLLLILPGYSSQSSVYVEFFGNSLPYSANFDQISLEFNQKISIGYRIGLGYLYLPKMKTKNKNFLKQQHNISLPLLANLLIGKRDKKFEVGIGPNLRFLRYSNEWDLWPTVTGTIGYRKQKKEKGFLFRAGFTPVYDLETKFIYPMAGLSLGASF